MLLRPAYGADQLKQGYNMTAKDDCVAVTARKIAAAHAAQVAVMAAGWHERDDAWTQDDEDNLSTKALAAGIAAAQKA